MKPFLLVLLAGSLLLNATIAALYVRGRNAPTDATPSSAASAARGPAAAQTPGIDGETWRGLDAAELPELVARLRASGFPPAIVRAITAAQIRESFAARRKALTAEYDTGPYWQNPLRDPKAQMALRTLEREQTKQLREVLGADAEPDDPMTRLNRERGLEFLSPAKADELRQLHREFDERRSDLYATGYSPITDRQKMDALEKEQQAAIARVLSPEELLDYNLRRSRTADRLRDELSAFKPTEEEYRAIFKVRAAFDEQFGDFTIGMNQEEMRRRSEAERLLKEQIKGVLPPQRAAEYDRLTDYNYRQTSRLVARLELPPQTADQLYALQKDFERRRSEIYSGGAANREQITQAVTALQQQAIASVTPVLGSARALEAYRQYGGTWISNLVPRPAIPPPAKK